MARFSLSPEPLACFFEVISGKFQSSPHRFLKEKDYPTSGCPGNFMLLDSLTGSFFQRIHQTSDVIRSFSFFKAT